MWIMLGKTPQWFSQNAEKRIFATITDEKLVIPLDYRTTVQFPASHAASVEGFHSSAVVFQKRWGV